MAWTLPNHWNPTRLMQFGQTVNTSTSPARVMTDAGAAYIKVLGNGQGPHVLATDWVGTQLAHWFGLSTFDIAILNLGPDDTFPLPRGHSARPGPAFAARAVAGSPWGRSAQELDTLVNPEDITRLVVFDTWTLNCDRHDGRSNGRKPNFDNVFLSAEGVPLGKRRLLAMDHGLCWIRSGEDLTKGLAGINKVQDEHVFGLFPEFHQRLMADTLEQCISRLGHMDVATAEAMIATVPDEWEVSPEARKAWSELVYRRAGFVADNVRQWIEKAAPWFGVPGA